jgi:hypothetical protein
MQFRTTLAVKRPRRRAATAGVAVLVLALGAGAWVAVARGSRDEKLSLVLDPSLIPAAATIDAVKPGAPARSLGRVVDSSGEASTFVLHELVVGAPSKQALDAFLSRTKGKLIDAFPAAKPGGPADYLVGVDASETNVAGVASALERLEPELGGRMRVSGPDALGLLSLAAREAAGRPRTGVVVGLNWVMSAASISDGTSTEVSPDGGDANAFHWPFINSGSEQDTGVGAAWTVLDAKKKLRNPVKVMVVDGGFVPDVDYPAQSQVLDAKWGEPSRVPCGRTSCPWHGTQVVLAAMARLDNRYGTAGPAGPVADLLAVGTEPDLWDTLRRGQDAVIAERPAVVNLSLSVPVTLFKNATEEVADRHFKSMVDAGALVVAAAGNDGHDVDARTCAGTTCAERTLFLPCESVQVLCVGGMGENTSVRAPGSNYGSVGGRRSVELYGPYVTIGLAEPNNPVANPATAYLAGTSYSSSFVAGVAALVEAADAKLSPEQVRTMLVETAHAGGVGSPARTPEGGRRINALGAVAKALGLDLTPPAVTIVRPVPNSTVSISDQVEFRGHATDFRGHALPISWRSNIDGPLNEVPTVDPVLRPSLSRGRHTITASATDLTGVVGTAEIVVNVVDLPPVARILSPAKSFAAYTTSEIALIGWTRDPETGEAVPDPRVSWEVRIAGQVVFRATGAIAAIPPGTLGPGIYAVRISAFDSVGKAGTERKFTVKEVPEGQTAPAAVISSPADGSRFVQHNGKPPAVVLKGAGHDHEDGPVPGTRYRWTAFDEQGTRVVLCTGSSFPGVSPKAAPRNCASVTAALGMDPHSSGETFWAITLEVADSSGLVSSKTISVTVASG